MNIVGSGERISETEDPYDRPAATGLIRDIFVQIRAVRGDHPLIPAETLLAVARQILQIVLVAIDVDKAVALADALMRADQIDSRPRTITEDLHAVADRQLQLCQVVAEVGDAVVIMHLVVGSQFIKGAEAIFGNNQRQRGSDRKSRVR